MKLMVFLSALSVFAGCRKGSGVTESEAASVRSLQQSISSIRSFVESQLRRNDGSPLYSFQGHCLDYSALWVQLFNDAGMEVALQQTVGVYYPKVTGKSVQRTPTHFFLAVNPGTADEIIIDPTYGQFFSGAERLNLTPVLVAKKVEVLAIYERHSSNLRMNVFGDEHTGEYDAREVAQMLYSFGDHSRSRTNMGD